MVSKLTDNKIKEMKKKFVKPGQSLPEGSRRAEVIYIDDLEQWLTQAFEEVYQEGYIQGVSDGAEGENL